MSTSGDSVERDVLKLNNTGEVTSAAAGSKVYWERVSADLQMMTKTQTRFRKDTDLNYRLARKRPQ